MKRKPSERLARPSVPSKKTKKEVTEVAEKSFEILESEFV